MSHPTLPSWQRTPRVLLVVEGIHDIGFLTRISSMLHAQNPTLPDLASMERQGQLVFVPFGGGDVRLWVDRLAPLSVPEFHLYDREASPETEIRQGVVRAINTRPQCRAVLTMKRSLENYLHPTAVHQAFDFDVAFGDNDNVADLIAQHLYNGAHKPPWSEIPRRAQVRSRNRVKKVCGCRRRGRGVLWSIQLHPNSLGTGQTMGVVAEVVRLRTEAARTEVSRLRLHSNATVIHWPMLSYWCWSRVALPIEDAVP